MSTIQIALNTLIATYCCNVPGAIIWGLVLFKLLKFDKKLKGLILLSVLMLSYHASFIAVEQTNYLEELYQGNQQSQFYDNKRSNVLNLVFIFISESCFALAHWLFAFNYWVLSEKVKMIFDEDELTDNGACTLNLINFLVSMLIIGLAASGTISLGLDYFEVYFILLQVVNLILLASCIVLFWGLKRLLNLTKDLDTFEANRSLIIWHLFAYILVIIALSSSFITIGNPKKFEITLICSEIVDLFSSVILAMIVYRIYQQCASLTQDSRSIVFTDSVQGTLDSNTHATLDELNVEDQTQTLKRDEDQATFQALFRQSVQNQQKPFS